jgi:hypothetical protein
MIGMQRDETKGAGIAMISGKMVIVALVLAAIHFFISLGLMIWALGVPVCEMTRYDHPIAWSLANLSAVCCEVSTYFVIAAFVLWILGW